MYMKLWQLPHSERINLLEMLSVYQRKIAKRIIMEGNVITWS